MKTLPDPNLAHLGLNLAPRRSPSRLKNLKNPMVFGYFWDFGFFAFRSLRFARKAPKGGPRGLKRRPRGPKTAPRGSKRAPSGPKRRQDEPREGPRRSQDDPKSPPSRFQVAYKPHSKIISCQSRPQEAPERPQEPPRGPQELPGGPQGAPKRPPRGPQEASKSSSWGYLAHIGAHFRMLGRMLVCLLRSHPTDIAHTKGGRRCIVARRFRQ